MRVVFVGPPGSGKGTQGKLLTERLGLTYFSSGDILRAAVAMDTPLGRQVDSYIKAGDLAPDDLVNAAAAEWLRRPDGAARGFILDGYPRTLVQAQALDVILAELKAPLDAVISFVIDDEEVLRRLKERRRADDDERTVRHRLRIDKQNARRLAEYYRRQKILHEIPAVGTVDETYSTIERILKPWAG